MTTRGARSERVTWLHHGLLSCAPDRAFGLWHVRAVFHLLVEAGRLYLVTPRFCAAAGHATVATFAPDGPTRCSGREVRGYSLDAIRDAPGDDFPAATNPVPVPTSTTVIVDAV